MTQLQDTIPLVDLVALHEPIREALHQVVCDVLDSGQWIQGAVVADFERAFAQKVGVRHAIGVSSGTDALLATMMALGIGPGDEVITTPFTFFATAEGIARLGATPVFVDIDPRTLNLNPMLLSDAINTRTRAIVPVHIFGQMADMASIRAIAAHHDLIVIEDAAQAIGATSHGICAGAAGHVGCFSFFPTKNLGAAGDGGAITTNDDALAARIRLMCRHGAQPKYHHVAIGGNFRLDAIQASILTLKLDHVDRWNKARQEHARFYNEVFVAHDAFETQELAPEHESVHHHYCILVNNRDLVAQRLRDLGIHTGVYYPKPLHLQPCFAHLGYDEQACPVASRVCARILSIPAHPCLTKSQRARVVHALLDVVP